MTILTLVVDGSLFIKWNHSTEMDSQMVTKMTKIDQLQANMI